MVSRSAAAATLPLAAFLLSACVAELPISQGPVAMAFTQAEAQARTTGFETATIRAILRQNRDSTEIAGVPCTVAGPGYSASFASPATLQLPLFGNSAPQVTVSCRYDGESRSTTLIATNLSEERRQANRDQLIGTLSEDGLRIGAVFNIDLTPERRGGSGGFDSFSYPDTSFTFRR